VSNLDHLHLYECKTYTLDKHISRKTKLQKRAHIDHLIDYEARNIFRIWISSQRKVIRIRDVIFDDNTEYNSFEIDLMQVVNELMLEIIYETQNLNSIINIVEEFSDEDVSKHKSEHIYSSTEDIAD
jgi:hypothetical protein